MRMLRGTALDEGVLDENGLVAGRRNGGFYSVAK